MIGVNALITTLGTLAVYAGSPSYTRTGDRSAANFDGPGHQATVPEHPGAGLVLIGVVIIAVLTMRETVFGRSLYAAGSNPTAARLVGVRTKRVIFFGFVRAGPASPCPG